MNCPTCGSSAPHLHPAVQHEGEVQPCRDAFHLTVTSQNTPERIAEVQALFRKWDLPGHVETVKAALIAATTAYPDGSWGDLMARLDEIRDADYRDGFVGGINAYAYSSGERWAENGVQYVGTSATKRADAVAKVEATYNYSPPSRR